MSSTAQLRAAGIATEIAGHVVWQKIRRPTAVTSRDVPVRAESITRGWLDAILCDGTPAAAVDSFTFGAHSIGTTTRRPLTVRYNGAGTAAGLPEEIFVKTTAPLTSRLLVGLIGASTNEARFYDTLRPLLDAETPHAYYLGLGGRAQHSTFLLEDVARTRGATFLDGTHHVDRASAEDMVGVMADVHSRFWKDPRLTTEWRWLRTPLGFQNALNDLTNFEKRTTIGIEKARSVVPPRLFARRGEIFITAMRSLELASRAPLTLCHHDAHIGNWYRTADGRMALYDWQGTVAGQGIGDLSYALDCALAVDDRRAWERDLVALWVDRLTIPPDDRPTVEEAWLAYRQQQFHGLLFWLYVAGQGRFQPETHPERLWRIAVERLATAVDDLESLDAL